MKIEDFGNYVISETDGHGKNGKGLKRTGSIQVRDYKFGSGYLIKYSTSYKINDTNSRENAISRCRIYIKENLS